MRSVKKNNPSAACVLQWVSLLLHFFHIIVPSLALEAIDSFCDYLIISFWWRGLENLKQISIIFKRNDKDRQITLFQGNAIECLLSLLHWKTFLESTNHSLLTFLDVVAIRSNVMSEMFSVFHPSQGHEQAGKIVNSIQQVSLFQVWQAFCWQQTLRLERRSRKGSRTGTPFFCRIVDWGCKLQISL